jgi:uncharacterized protein with GYD domain
MPMFMCFLNWTDEGAKALKQGPGRFETAKSLAEGLGGRIVAAYVTTGQYDVVHILDMPNGDAMTKYSIAVSSAGAARTTTVRAYTTEEWAKLLAEAP